MLHLEEGKIGLICREDGWASLIEQLEAYRVSLVDVLVASPGMTRETINEVNSEYKNLIRELAECPRRLVVSQVT